MRRATRHGAAAIAAGLLLGTSGPAPVGKPMSVSSRILLNRLAVTGRTRGEIMLLAADTAGYDRLMHTVDRLHGRVRRAERTIGYMRVDLPLGAIVVVGDSTDVAAYEVSSLSKGAWYRDGPPQENSEMFREREVERVSGSDASASPPPLPRLSTEASRTQALTGDAAGVGDWLSAHPTFDGRGVTIALIESGEPEFLHPAMSLARTLDGRPIPKIAGILNPLDPGEPDDTRVELDTVVDAVGTWQRVGQRTYILPRPGHYRLGFFSVPEGANLAQTFAVLEDEATGDIRVDADGDADFRNDPPSADVNAAFAPRTLRLRAPRPLDVAFVVARDLPHHRVHVYLARDGHQTMTASVAAGTRTPDSLAYGVAPGARLLLVRGAAREPRLRDLFEAYLEAAKRADVDILGDSIGDALVPDTSGEFGALFFRRLIAFYHKPVFHAAGNGFQLLNNVSAFGDVFSVGGAIDPATFAAFYGGHIDGTIVHPMSAAGPGIDGLFKPDFVAPVTRIAADLLTHAAARPLPKRSPSRLLPGGYQVSCCTSASSPYAAGVAALLLSAARQQSVVYSVARLGAALRAGARFVPDAPAYAQGAGLIDVGATWRALQRAEPPHIEIAGPVVEPLAMYGIRGRIGAGLFERTGWTPGARGSRVMQLTRTSGADEPRTYRLTWTGNDGTFAAPASIALPLRRTVPVPLDINVAAAGAHSALLNAVDPQTSQTIARAMPTVVAPLSFDANHAIRFDGAVQPMHTSSQYVAVPPGAGAIAIELQVLRGSLAALVVPAHGMIREYYDNVWPAEGRNFTAGRYRLLLPNPAPGVWSMTLINGLATLFGDAQDSSDVDADYVITMRLLSAAMTVGSMSERFVTLNIANRAAALDETAIDVAPGRLRSREAETAIDGLPTIFDVDVAPGAGSLSLQLHGASRDAQLELYLYDCTSGECFSYDFTVPAARDQSMAVRTPHPGRWRVVVDSAPFPARRERFLLQTIVAGAPHRQAASTITHAPGTEWTELIGLSRDRWDAGDGSPVLVFELVDAAAEREGRTHPWEVRAGLPNLAERPAVVGRGFVRLN
jgi:subtilisin family serine protease